MRNTSSPVPFLKWFTKRCTNGATNIFIRRVSIFKILNAVSKRIPCEVLKIVSYE